MNRTDVTGSTEAAAATGESTPRASSLPPRIDPEFKALIPPLSPEEYAQLEANIISDKKCHNAIVIWNNILLDGHNRMRICAENNIQFEIIEMDFESREEAMLWILENQLGRRNLNDAMRIQLALSKVELLKEQAKKNQSRAGGDKSGKGVPQIPPGMPEAPEASNPDDTRTRALLSKALQPSVYMV